MRSEVRSALAKVRARCVHLPIVTATAIAAVIVTALRYRVFTHDLPLTSALRYGFSGRALTMGHWSTLVTSQFLSRDAFMAVSLALSLALMLGVYEAVVGTWRALVVTVVTAMAGPLLVAAALGLGSALGNSFAARAFSTLDYGASAVTAGAGGALVAVLGMRRLRWFAVFWVVVGLLLHHQLADWEHVGSFAVGYGLGHLLGAAPLRAAARDRRRASAWLRPRWLVAPVVVPALLVGALLGNAIVPPTGHVSLFAAGFASKNADPAQVQSISYPAPSLSGMHQALVMLPAGYDRSTARYPVVEMLHGRPGTPNDIFAGLDPIGAAAAAAVPPFIGVAPDGHGPAVFEGQWADTSRQRLGTAVSVDLRRYVDAHYRSNGHWSVSGLSDGGYGAAYLASRTPGQYDSVCSMSGSFTAAGPAFVGQSRAVLDAVSPILHARAGGPRTLLIVGRADPRVVRDALGYAQALQRARQSVQTVAVPGGHTWSVWKSAFPRCLAFMLGPSAPPSSAPRPACPTVRFAAAASCAPSRRAACGAR